MQASTSVVDCQSCGEQNGSDMSFCLHCGKVLSSSVQAQRDVQGVKKRQCKSCGRADELNNRYCIFCGSDIKAFVAQAANPEALARFTSDLSQFSAEPVETMRPTPEILERPSPSPTVYKTKPVGKTGHGAAAFSTFLALGTICGAGLAFAFKGPTLSEAYNLLTLNAPKEGLVIFTKQPTVRVVVESKDRTRYTLGQTNKGTLAINDLEPGFHRVIMSVPGYGTVVETVDLLKSKLNILGYDQRVDASSNKH